MTNFKRRKRGSKKQIGKLFPTTKREAIAYNKLRSEKAQNIDEDKIAPITKDYEKWAKNPNRLDVRGVDYFPVKPVTGDFQANVDNLLKSFEERFNVKLTEKIIPTHTLQEFADASNGSYTVSQVRNFGGFHGSKAIVLSPNTTKILEKGRIDNLDDAFGFHVLAHEMAHHTSGFKSGLALDEGCTDIVAERWMRDHVTIDKKIRADVWAGETNLSKAYPRERQLMLRVALIMGDGDFNKAVDWIDTANTKDSTHEVRAKLMEVITKDIGKISAQRTTHDIVFVSATSTPTPPSSRIASKMYLISDLSHTIKELYGISDEEINNYHLRY